MKKEQLILIDDDKAELQLCKEALRLSNVSLEVITFDSSPQALQHIRDNACKIFIIVSDINMPDMTGLELLERINQDHDLKMELIPFIFLSSSADPTEIEVAFSLNAQGYFIKPYTLSNLCEIFKVLVSYWSTSQMPRYIHEFKRAG